MMVVRSLEVILYRDVYRQLDGRREIARK